MGGDLDVTCNMLVNIRGRFVNLKLVRGIKEGDAISYKKLRRSQIKEPDISPEELEKLKKEFNKEK